jgi:hypothetical protein
MTARETMERFARRIPGGIAWERDLFRRADTPPASELIDAAVDIAWECLTPENALEHPSLDIMERGALLVIRLSDARAQLDLPLAA